MFSELPILFVWCFLNVPSTCRGISNVPPTFCFEHNYTLSSNDSFTVFSNRTDLFPEDFLFQNCLIQPKNLQLKNFYSSKANSKQGYNTLCTEQISGRGRSFYQLSPKLKANFLKRTNKIIIQFKAILKDKHTYHKFSLIPKYNILSLSILDENRNPFKYLKYPIDLYFRNTKTNDIPKQVIISLFSNKRSVSGNDELVTIYKMDSFPTSGPGLVFVKYHNCSLLQSKFKILALENQRPDFDTINHLGKTISTKNPIYKVILNTKLNGSLYLGFIGFRMKNVEKKDCIGFEVKYFQCYSQAQGKWTTDGCLVGKDTTEDLLHCQCWHLSLFGGSGPISPKGLDFQQDIKLFLNIHEDSVAFLVGFMILLYLIIVVWTRHADRKDELQRFVVVLDDNFPGEEWPYLITVYTGYWIGSSTDSNIGIRLYGTKGMSRVHNLMSNHQRQVLKGNSDDWFLIFTLKNLGLIERIHIFSDFTGPSPDWYCKKIMVYDLEQQKDYKFIVEKWVSLEEENECVDLYCEPTPMTRLLRRDQIAMDNIAFGLRETHLLLSIFTRHPRSSVTRSQRLSILLCLFFLHMLTNIMFYQMEENSFPQYSNEKRKLVIQIESSLLSSPVIFMIIFCFKKSRIVTAPKKNVPMTLTSTAAIPLESGLTVNQGKRAITTASMNSITNSLTNIFSTQHIEKNEDQGEEETEEEEEEVEEEGESEIEEEETKKKSCIANCCSRVKTFFTQTITVKTVMPVKIAEEDENSSQIRKQWMVFAWSLCIFITCLSAFFILIYSLKMNQELMKEWLIESSRLSMKNIFLMSPLKIIIFSSTLALLYGQLQYIASFECNTEEAMKEKFTGNNKFLSKILEIRKNKWYRPLTMRHTIAVRKKERNWRRWRIVISFSVVCLLYFILSVEVKMTWAGPYLQTNQHFINMLHPHLSNIKIDSLASYVSFLKAFIIPSLDSKRWYNDMSHFDPKVWHKNIPIMKDHVSKIVGIPRIRQQRTKPDSCSVPEPMIEKGFTKECIAPLTLFSIDTKDYALQWTQVEKVSSAVWTYEYSESGSLFLCSSETTKCYGNGGYMSHLKMKSEDSFDIIDENVETEWFDVLTRVLFFEFASYNVNTLFVCHTAVIVERLADGSYHTTVDSIMLKSRSSGFYLQLMILMVFTFYYGLRIILIFNRKGLEYLFSSIGLLDSFLNALLYFTMISLTLDRNARIRYIDNWQKDDERDLQIPKELILHRTLVRYETAILVIITPAQVFHNLRVGKKCKVCFDIWDTCIRYALGLGFVTIISFMGLHLIDTILEIESWHCLFSKMYSPLSYHMASYSKLQPWPLTLIFCFTINVTAYLACVAIVITYKEVKSRSLYIDDFNIFAFLAEKVRQAKQKMKRGFLRLVRNVFQLDGMRKRAGTDEKFYQTSGEFLMNRPVSHMKFICQHMNTSLDSLMDKIIELDNS